MRSLGLAVLSALLLAAGPPQDVPDPGVTCWSLGYENPETLPDGVRGEVDGDTLTLVAPGGTAGDICVKGGPRAPELLSFDEARAYTHTHDISHWGHKDVRVPVVPPEEPDPEPEPEPWPLPEVFPDPDCATGPDPDGQEYLDAEQWREWYEDNCVVHSEPSPEPQPEPEPAPEPASEPEPDPAPAAKVDTTPTLPDTGIPAALLALIGAGLFVTGIILARR